MNKRQENKLSALAYLGGRCKKCGYKNPKCLTFHHLDPKTKKANISEMLGLPFDLIKKELKKCIILCCNCHCEEHNY